MNIIASRVYEVSGQPLFHVMIFRPTRHSSGNFLCKYKIEGPKTKIVSDFGGADEFQALMNTIYMVRMAIETCDEYLEGRLSFHGFKGYLDLPDPALHPTHPGMPPLTEPLPVAPSP
ncbi:DUF6968 family protein [Roseomonas sp. F4]